MPIEGPKSRIYFGRVMHKRLRPFAHRFDYRVYAFLFDLDELQRLDRELPGFTRREKSTLAALVLSHRGRLSRERVAELHPGRNRRLLRVAVLLRLASHLHHSRSTKPLPPITLRIKGNTLTLQFPEGWLDEHPLTRADLAGEAEALQAAGFSLSAR